jgi:cobalt-zinc-cadmium efflux system membrane fusion protein
LERFGEASLNELTIPLSIPARRRSFMSSRVRTVLVEIARRVPTLLVLAGLAAVGIWGHNNDWKIPAFAALFKKDDDESEKSEKSEKPDDDDRPPGAIVLASDDAARDAGLENEPARRESVAEYVEAPAVLDFKHSKYAQLAPRASGSAWRVLVSSGAVVKKGDLLALVSAPDLGTAKAEFLNAQIQYEIRLKTLQRLRAIGDSVPERQLREAELNLREGKVRLVNAQQALSNLSLPLRLKDLENLTDAQIADKVRMLGLPSYLAGEDDLPGNLLPLIAPFDGLVIRQNIVVGEVVGPTQSAFTVADVSKLWVQMDVRLEDAGRLGLRHETVFEAASTGQSASGEIIWISAEVDPKTRTVRARAEVNNPHGELRPATFGKARVRVSRTPNALTVPDSALQWDGTGNRVFVRIDDRTYEPRVALVKAREAGRTSLLDSRLLLGPALAGSFATNLGLLPGLATLPVNQRLFREVQSGEQVVTIGSHVLKSEMLKSRIGGED